MKCAFVFAVLFFAAEAVTDVSDVIAAEVVTDVCDANGSCDDNSLLMVHTAMKKSSSILEGQLIENISKAEPRCSLMNMRSKSTMKVNNSWHASFDCQSDRCNWFKIQKKETNDKGEPTIVLIRTDWHPQSLLDYRSLAFEGSALDSGKAYQSSRWWEPFLIAAHPDSNLRRVNMAIYAFRVYDSAPNVDMFLAGDGNRVFLKSFSKTENLTADVMWGMSIIGSAMSPFNVASTFAVMPVAMTAGFLTGGFGAVSVLAPMGWQFPAAVGAAAAGVPILTSSLMGQVSRDYFVDW